MFAKRFFYASVGLFLLALSFSIMPSGAGAVGMNRVVAFFTNPATSTPVTLMSNGDSYAMPGGDPGVWEMRGNVFASSGFQSAGDEVVAATARFGHPLGVVAISAQGYFYVTGDDATSWTHESPIFGFVDPPPTGKVVVGISRPDGSADHMAVLTADGNVYTDAMGWNAPVGNIFGGPVNVQRQTFGQLKARYR